MSLAIYTDAKSIAWVPRFAIVRVHMTALAAFCMRDEPGYWWRTVSGVPADAIAVAVWADEPRQEVCIKLSHPSFALALPGTPIEELTPQFECIRPNQQSPAHGNAPVTLMKSQ